MVRVETFFLCTIISFKLIVPVLDVLHKRILTVSRVFPTCGLNSETLDHMLFQCCRVARIWTASPFRFRPEVLANASFTDLWSNITTLYPGTEWKTLGLFASFCWNIWKARNELVFTGSRSEEVKISAKALEEFNEYSETLGELSGNQVAANGAAQTKWESPPVGTLKINVDGAFVKETGKGGVGFVVRDHEGRINQMSAIPISNAFSAEFVEAMGISLAVSKLQSEGRINVIFEGDAQRVIKMMQVQSSSTAFLEAVIYDALAFSRIFNSCIFQFIPRDCNRVADLIAKYALSLDSPLSWTGDYPGWAQLESSLDLPTNN